MAASGTRILCELQSFSLMCLMLSTVENRLLVCMNSVG